MFNLDMVITNKERKTEVGVRKASDFSSKWVALQTFFF